MASDAERLSQLGYPLSWCIRALEATGNNLDEAVEYMINYSSFLEQEVREEEKTKQHRIIQETVAEEDGWMVQVGRELGLRRGLPRAVPDHRQLLSGTKEWGFRMMVSPCYSREVSKSLAQDPGTRERLDCLQDSVNDFTPAQDAALIDFINEYCAKEGTDPLSLSPASLFPGSPETETEQTRRAMKYLPSILLPIPTVRLGLRFIILRNFNRRLSRSLPLVDLSTPDSESQLARKIRALRSLIFTSVKRTMFERVLQDSHTGDGASMQREKNPTVVLDRSSSGRKGPLGDEGDGPGGKSGDSNQQKKLNVFGQLFSQLYRKVPLSQLRNSERAFYAILAGEHSDDYGGPYRDALNQACEELTTSGTLFTKCPSGKYVPNPRATSATAIEMLEFVGVLIGIAMRTKTPLALDMASLVWKRLCGQQITFDDIRTLDPAFGARLDALIKITNNVSEEKARQEWMATCADLDLRFAIQGADGRLIELVPGGRDIPVKFESRRVFLKLAMKHRMEDGYEQCMAMARGMATQIPQHLLSLFTWQEVETMVCGPAIIDVEILRKCTVYGEGLDEHSLVVQYFWQVMESFTEEEKRKYLRFVWGRTRLPLSVNDWDRKHKINILDLTNEDEDDDGDERNANDYLPIGHTCFFSIDLPKYSSQQVVHDKLLYAITNCITIDADETTNARRSAEQDRTGARGVDEANEDLGFD